MWPWDVDLSFGRVWNSAETYWNENLLPNTSLFVGRNNRLPDAIFNTPEARQMYLRRIRTLMDEFPHTTVDLTKSLLEILCILLILTKSGPLCPL